MMEGLLLVSTQVGVLFALMAVGFVCRKVKLLNEASVKGMIDLLVVVVTPAIAVQLTLVAALWALKSPLHLDHAMMIALVVSSAAPTAALPAMFAARYGSDVSTSVGMVSGTTLLSIVTMPLVVALALAIL